MPDLTLQADPDVWSVVPYPDEALACETPASHTSPMTGERTSSRRPRWRCIHAPELEAPHVFLLDAVEHRLLGALAVFRYDDVPLASDQDQAEAVASAMVPSVWGVQSIAADAGKMRGWRVTVVDKARTEDSQEAAFVIEAVWTVYVLNADGRCVVSLLSPMAPFNAALAQMYTGRMLETIEVVSA